MSRNAGSGRADHVVAVVPRDRLSAALSATHRAGFGPHCRVFDGARDDVRRQLERAGLRVQGEVMIADGAVLIVVLAPGRTAVVAELFHELNAEAVYYAARRELTAPEPHAAGAALPDIRIGPSEADAGR
jgi:hypothetical protein